MNNLYAALVGGPGREDLQKSAPATPGIPTPSSLGVPGPSLFESLSPVAGNFPVLINQKDKGQIQKDVKGAFGPKGSNG